MKIIFFFLKSDTKPTEISDPIELNTCEQIQTRKFRFNKHTANNNNTLQIQIESQKL